MDDRPSVATAGTAEVKSVSQSLRFVIANHSPREVSEVGPPSGLGRIRDRNALSFHGSSVSPLRFPDELWQNIGNFRLFRWRFGETFLH
jgi:hypothetical protein